MKSPKSWSPSPTIVASIYSIRLKSMLLESKLHICRRRRREWRMDASLRAEITLGKVLKKKKWRRSSYIVSTKLFWGGKYVQRRVVRHWRDRFDWLSRAETEKGLSRKHVIEGLRASLERLQLDYVDIVFANKPDASVPMEGTDTLLRSSDLSHCVPLKKSSEPLPKWSTIISASIGAHLDGHRWRSW